jgi:hypothetical protein
MKYVRLATAFVLGFCVLGAGCSDHDARSDLAVDKQKLDTTDVRVAVFPDAFPNVAHKCMDYSSGPLVGMYTTTDRFVVLVYNDPACPGSNPEQAMTVVNMGSRQAVADG